MKKLLSLPPNLVSCFHDVTGYSRNEWFCSNDPIGSKLGSGGGSVWLLEEAYRASGTKQTIDEWIASERRLLLHAGGQSRRLPAYAPSGKVLTPIPVYRWERGQKLSQNLLQLQIPLYERLMEAAPDTLHTMIVSGDVLIRTSQTLPKLPEADIVCLGLWLDAEVATNHGVFVCDRRTPAHMKCMLQKPSVEKLNELKRDNLYLTDIGVWLLSDRAVSMLMKRSHDGESIRQYDLYSEFGCALGYEPTLADDEVNSLSVAVIPLQGGEFYHFGTSREIISSSLRLQNVVSDQREIMHHSQKPHPSMFVQNSEVWIKISEQNQNLWIENSSIGEDWTICRNNIITGVPENAWKIDVRDGQCVDIVPVGDDAWAVRPYGFSDAFRGKIGNAATLFIGQPFAMWAAARHINIDDIASSAENTTPADTDLQAARIFPVVKNVHDMGLVLRWMMNEPEQDGGRILWTTAEKMSADEISDYANLHRLNLQRREYRHRNWAFLAKNHQHSVFYQIDLEDAAKEFAEGNIAEPHPIGDDEPLMIRINDAMFRSEWARRRLEKVDAGTAGDIVRKLETTVGEQQKKAFSLLSDGIVSPIIGNQQHPRMDVYSDQIVWGRSPVRIDIAGGWTDTPPFCLMEGGNVINLAIELNGQQPIQTYIRPSKEYHIVLRSIDLGATEVVETYEQLAEFNKVGSPFSIPKAALALAGFYSFTQMSEYSTLRQQLEDFGCGIEITLLSAIPAGSGLGTSSILAATVLGAISNFCGLGWDKNEIGQRTLVLEQLLTTGGGWQDQFGGILEGVKLLQTERGFMQSPVVRWLPEQVFTQAEYQPCHMLYYTGITRTAKLILEQIVRRMFLNQGDELQMLRQMKEHTMQMYEAIQQGNFETMGRLVRKTWAQNQLLDSGTNPPEIEQLTKLIDDYCLGYKLPGAGGGGYLYMIAKDADAAVRIRETLTAHPLNRNARFVEMNLSKQGFQCSRS